MRGSIIRVGMAAVLALAVATACGGKGPDEDEFGSGAGEFDEGMSERSDLYGGKSGGLETVYFDYDRWEIRSDAASTLQQNAGTIGSKQYSAITIEGHCDERGSEEYNLALGEKRANSVKRYLTNLGVSSTRMQTVSYGESQPAVQGHDESAWRYNRRAEFRVER